MKRVTGAAHLLTSAIFFQYYYIYIGQEELEEATVETLSHLTQEGVRRRRVQVAGAGGVVQAQARGARQGRHAPPARHGARLGHLPRRLRTEWRCTFTLLKCGG